MDYTLTAPRKYLTREEKLDHYILELGVKVLGKRFKEEWIKDSLIQRYFKKIVELNAGYQINGELFSWLNISDSIRFIFSQIKFDLKSFNPEGLYLRTKIELLSAKAISRSKGSPIEYSQFYSLIELMVEELKKMDSCHKKCFNSNIISSSNNLLSNLKDPKVFQLFLKALIFYTNKMGLFNNPVPYNSYTHFPEFSKYFDFGNGFVVLKAEIQTLNLDPFTLLGMELQSMEDGLSDLSLETKLNIYGI